jgi:hypothetical protein
LAGPWRDVVSRQGTDDSRVLLEII